MLTTFQIFLAMGVSYFSPLINPESRIFLPVLPAIPVTNSVVETNAKPLSYPIITKQQVEKICRTMSLAEVEAILGSTGQAIDDSTTPAAKSSHSYEWRNSDGSYVWVVFAEGEIIGMGQVGISGMLDRINHSVTSPINEPLLKDCP